MRIFAIALLLIITTQGFAQETTRINTISNQLEILKVDTPGLDQAININITQTTLANFLLAISKVHELNINVSPELSSINIVNNFSDVSVGDILIFLVKEYELDIDFTGNILSIKKYEKPTPEDAPVSALYNPASQLVTLDLKNDKLERVFRTIMDLTAKNLLFSPDIQNAPLTLYIKDVPLDVALDKLAQTNNLTLSKSRDGFYVFDGLYPSADQVSNSTANGNRPVRRRRANFYYKVLDTLNRKVEVDLQNTPIADVIYTLGDDLNLDIFTASPLDNAGVATVKAESIDFDLLLSKIFQSAITNTAARGQSGGNRNNVPSPSVGFTYKKDGDVYYFGTEDQLSLKQVELVQLINRSINLFSDPTRSTQSSRNQSFVTGGTNVYNGGNSNNGIGNQTTRSGSSSNTDSRSLEENIPDGIKEGLDLKTDFELNSFIVSGPGVKVERFKEFIAEIDKAVPVIFIEVMIMEVSRSAIVETGVSFGLGENPSTTAGAVFPSTDIRLGAETVNKVIGSFNGFGSLNIGKVLPEFYLDIKAMESNGNLKIISTPQLAALNGHKAYLSSSNTTYYAVTNQSFIGSQIPQTTQIRNYVPISAELALEIKPFVSGDGQITLDVQVIQSSFNGERIEEDAPPGINTREFSSIIRMQAEDVAVLGGIDQKIKDDTGSGVPLLARIPIIKWLFSKRRREDTKRSLTVLLKPTVFR